MRTELLRIMQHHQLAAKGKAPTIGNRPKHVHLLTGQHRHGIVFECVTIELQNICESS